MVGEPEPAASSPADFLGSISAALSDPDPLAFLALASSIVAALDPRTHDPFDPQAAEERPDAALLLETLVGHSAPETTALLLAFSHLLSDNHLAQRARREAGRRDHAMPAWLLGLDEAEPGPAAASADVLGDGQNTIVSVRLVDGHELTAVVYIDHNLGTVAKDGFVIPGDLAGFRDEFLALADEPEAMTFTELHPAEARAQIAQAIETGAMTVPRFETDTWPAARPMVEWVIGLLPAGGTGFERPEWTDEARSTLADEFLRSAEGAGLTRRDDAAIAEDLLWFTTEYSGGSPWRWSMVNVEILLTDWYPRKVIASPVYLRRMPTVLRAMVRYAHRLRQIPRQFTEQTLAAVDAYQPAYLELITAGPSARSSHLGSPGGLDLDELVAHYATHKRELAVRAVGSEQALADLDDTPLPDEDFRWAGIPEDIHPRVAEVLRLCDRCAEELFDVELRTAFRRVLARTAATDPAVFRRRSKDTTAAAAIAWAVATVNDRLGAHRGGLPVKDLLAHFGVSGSVSQRAQPFLRAFGAVDAPWAGDLTFGSPEVLTADRRARLIQIRDDAGA